MDFWSLVLKWICVLPAVIGCVHWGWTLKQHNSIEMRRLYFYDTLWFDPRHYVSSSPIHTTFRHWWHELPCGVPSALIKPIPTQAQPPRALWGSGSCQICQIHCIIYLLGCVDESWFTKISWIDSTAPPTNWIQHHQTLFLLTNLRLHHPFGPHQQWKDSQKLAMRKKYYQ